MCRSAQWSQRCDTRARRSRGWQRGWTHPPHRAAECRACLQPRQPGPVPGWGRCSQQPACTPRAGAVLPARVPSKRDATPGPVPRSCLQQGSPLCQGMRDPCSEDFMCQGGSSSLRRFRRGTGLPAESYPDRLDSIFLQGTISQLQGVFSPETRVQEVHRQAWRSRTGRQGAWMEAWEYQEPSQGAGMRKSGSNLGMDTWKEEEAALA